jgi:hypothetical protein
VSLLLWVYLKGFHLPSHVVASTIPPPDYLFLIFQRAVSQLLY